MTLSPAWLDELRARTVLSAVIAPSVKLIRAGREFKACCPFHNEKTPSFTVNDDKHFYHCMAGETRVLTASGSVPIADLAGRSATVLTRGGQWVDATFAAYGVQRLWEIRLSRNGVAKSLYATSHHRWFVRGRKSDVLTQNLRPGHRLQSILPGPAKDWQLDPEGVRHGIMFGDGTLYRGTYGTLNLHGEKDRQLASWFPDQSAHSKTRTNGQSYLRVYGGRAFAGMKQPPRSDSGPAYRLGFLAGYLAADGHVAKDGTVSLNSSRAENLQLVRDLALTLGIGTYGITTQLRRGLAKQDCALHRIHFVTSTLSPLLFLLSEARKRFESRGKRFDRMRWTVTGVAESEREEEVFCAVVPDEHAFALDDNILTGNCFGCGAHGDAIRFLTDHRGLPFMDAVKELAAKAGMEVPAPDPQSRERAEKTSSLTEVTAAAQLWFAEQLAGPGGAAARDYCQRRGIDAAAIERFGIGLAPDSRNGLKRALVSLGEDRLIETGMLIQPEEPNKASYDRFRGRLMIPIRDARGRVIAFGGRILGDGEPKYLNSPDTPLFDKGRTLYNLDRAGPASRKTGRLIVVEGYMDVIACHRAGISEVVAPNGTAVTEAQLERMWRLDPAPILCFDGDAAGRKAAIRAAIRALPHLAPDRTLRFVELPAGQDPDDLVNAGGREAVEALLAEPEPLDARLWRHELEAQSLTTPESRAGLRQRLINHASSIRDNGLSRLYRSAWVARFVDLIAPQVASQTGRIWKPFQRPRWPEAIRFLQAESTQDDTRALAKKGFSSAEIDAVIEGLFNYPETLPELAESLVSLPAKDRRSIWLRDELLAAVFSGTTLDREALNTILGVDGTTSAGATRAMGFSFTRRDSDPERARSDLAAALEIIAARQEVGQALHAATERLKQDTSDELYQEQQRLIAAQQGLRERLAQLAGTD